MRTNMDSSLAIVVVNYGSHRLVETNIAKVSAHTPEAAVIIVDNFSDLDERDAICGLADRQDWTLLTSSTNIGFGGGVNMGVSAAIASGAQRFLLLNPDAFIGRKDLTALQDAVAADPHTMVAPRIFRSDGTVWFDGSDVYLDIGETRSTRRRNKTSGARLRPWLTGACLMISRELWELVGGFNEEYFLYWEDVDLSFRVVAAGGNLRVLKDASAIHDEGGTHMERSHQGRAKSTLYYYYNIRNRLLFAALNLPPADLAKWKRTAIPAAYDILLRGGRRQFFRPAGAVLAAARGTRDGWKLSKRPLGPGEESLRL